MATATMPPTQRPLPNIPASVHTSDVWRDASGVLTEHAVELPVDKTTKKVNGKLFACIMPDCSTAEWVIEPKEHPKSKHCPADGQQLAFVPLDDTQRDPVAVGRQKQLAWLSGMLSDKRERAAAAIRKQVDAELAKLRTATTLTVGELAKDMRGHVPSLAATAAVEIGVLYVVDLTGPLEAAALATAIGTWGAVVGYVIAVRVVEKARLWRRGERLEGRAAKKARQRGLYAARALVGTGLYFGMAGAIDASVGLDLTSGWQASLAAVVGLALAWVVNKAHWDDLWAERRRIRELAEQARIAAAQREAQRLEQESMRLAEESRLREQLADVGAYDEDDPVHQGERMKIEWERIGRLDTAPMGFPEIGRTWIIPEQTREITAPDPITGEKTRIGWEFMGACKPGALISRGSPTPPLMVAKEWLVSVLHDGRYTAGMISLVDRPGERANTFLVMITEQAPLGDAVNWKGAAGIRIEKSGARYGHLGRALTGDDLEELLYPPGQPFGGLVTGTTGGGKGGHAMRYILNCLLAGILPVLFDPKGLVDYVDFAGIFPIGFTDKHREIILKSLHAERARRQAVAAAAPKKNRYGQRVAGESKWDTRAPNGEIGVFGEPIASIWDEFHDLAKDEKFIKDLTKHVRLQRAAGMGALLLTQGGGLDDLGSSVLRDLVNQTSLTSYRSGELQSRLGGQRNATYSTADLPMLPGMCLRQAPGSLNVPLRAAFIPRDPDAADTVFTTLWGKGTTKVLQIEDPMNWISAETTALWETTGLMELWRKARGGRNADGTWNWDGWDNSDALLAEIAAEEGAEPAPSLPAAPAAAAVSATAAGAGRMAARDVLLAILHEEPGINLEGIYSHSAWLRAPGSTGKFPPPATVMRAAGRLDPTIGGVHELEGGKEKLIDRGPRSKSWTLTEAGREIGAEAAARLAPAVIDPGPAQPMQETAEGETVSDMERHAQRQEELRYIARQETDAAAGHD